MRVNVRQLLRFFDEKPDGSAGHATAVVGVIGEDLNAAVLKHCLVANGFPRVNVRGDPVTTQARRGPRLDRWIEVDLPSGEKIIFQTEIKNWSAHAIGGKCLALDASPTSVETFKRDAWKGQWKDERRTLRDSSTAKVLVHMKPPAEAARCRSLRPLLIFWTAMRPQDQCGGIREVVPGGHLFRIENPTCDFHFKPPENWSPHKVGFQELWVFSVSSYLRTISEDVIALDMPKAARTMEWLNRLVPPAARPAATT